MSSPSYKSRQSSVQNSNQIENQQELSPKQNIKQQQDQVDSPEKSQLSSAQNKNIFEDVQDSPFKDQKKDYGDKYNKVINRIRDSTSLNDLARKYNKIHLPINNSSEDQQQNSQKFIMENDLQELNQSVRKSFDKNQKLNGSFFTPSKSNDPSNSARKLQISSHRNTNSSNYLRNSTNNFITTNYRNGQLFAGKRGLDNFDLRNSSGLSSFSRNTQDSIVPNILDRIQQNQKRYKSPTNKISSPLYKTLKDSQNFFKSSSTNLNFNLQQNVLLQPSSSPINLSGEFDSTASRSGAYLLKKNFKNFMQDSNLGYKSNTSQTYRNALSPQKNFLRQSSPVRNYQKGPLYQYQQSLNNTSKTNFRQSNLDVSRAGFDDILNKIQKKKIGIVNQRGGSSGYSNYQGGAYFSTSKSGKTHEFEYDLDTMRLNSLFVFNKKRSQQVENSIFRSPSLNKRKGSQ